MSDILNQATVLVLNRNSQTINVRTPQDASCLVRYPVRRAGVVPRNTVNAALANLRNRLLRDTLEQRPDQPLAALLPLAAAEAEALAWLTPFPLLFFPALFEEKVSAARDDVARQRQLKLAPARTG
jgi:hypothetical protein